MQKWIQYFFVNYVASRVQNAMKLVSVKYGKSGYTLNVKT